MGEKCSDAFIKFEIIIAGDDVGRMSLNCRFDYAVVFWVAANADISGKQYMLASFLDKDQQF